MTTTKRLFLMAGLLALACTDAKKEQGGAAGGGAGNAHATSPAPARPGAELSAMPADGGATAAATGMLDGGTGGGAGGAMDGGSADAGAR
jgi:hypothetical protein